MNDLVRLTLNEDGDVPDDRSWHLSADSGGSDTILCTVEVFNELGSLASEGAAFAERKSVNRGGVTCPICLQMIHSIKSYKY